MNYVARYTHLSRSKDDLSELGCATVQKKKRNSTAFYFAQEVVNTRNTVVSTAKLDGVVLE